MWEKIKEIFKPKKEEERTQLNYEREMRELLRENLNTVSVDMFELDDPIVLLTPSQRREYLLYFHKLFNEKKLITRIKYLINKQAVRTLANSTNDKLDVAGTMKIDGMALIKDDVERLSNMFSKEEDELSKKPLSAIDALRL